MDGAVQGLPVDMRSLIAGLLEPTPQLRLGCLMGGIGSLTDHTFFGGFPWARLADRSLEPPFVPVLNEFGGISLDPKGSDSEHSDSDMSGEKGPNWSDDVHSSGGSSAAENWGEWASW